ncbi:polysaccharide pyruvyl transferase family protein [Lamprobacter modestohalophilus]|uniref:polysaccharide pyruvyl transferase family protein n=1 Tax=Lamprobacter modestohalophilus TaxID=1064514 RepID=UPI002ADEC68A|nr:polysaccharide pyruvyl transferase family protein [Lamprobacter modestohalophilus]MEA1050962.1 polysaccharide pyruvyl transferase family protein [Lamprobacter modestohalophilus]
MPTSANLTSVYTDTIKGVLNPLIPMGASIALFDFPNHSNVGDSAIWLGEEAYLVQQRHVKISTVNTHKISQLPTLPIETLILIHGGGNFGDLWPYHQHFREKIIAHYLSHRIIQLPQSIHFKKLENVAQCKKIIHCHQDFHLLVRDQESLEQGRRLHDGSTQLCPDMALCLEHLPRSKAPNHPIVGLLRTDKERVTAELAPENADKLMVCDWLQEPASATQRVTAQVERLQAHYPRWTTRLNALKRHLYHRLAMQRLRRGCDVLSSGQVVITDRLHGHILCTLMGIPHVVLDNHYRKISNFREAWGTGQGFCQAARTLEEAIYKAQSLRDNIR